MEVVKGNGLPAHLVGLKRKRESLRSSGSKDTLRWRPVPRAQLQSGLDDAVLSFEEIDGVDVEFEEVEGGGRIAKFSSNGIPNSRISGPQKVPRTENRVNSTTHLDDDFDAALLPEWSHLELLPTIKRYLHAATFLKPSEIQSKAIPEALAGRDVIGVAETGSGKTLAYGLPILQKLLSAPVFTSTRRSVKALILVPTRELALQVSEHLHAIVKVGPSEEPGPRPPPPVSVAAIVGGMSMHKQKRVLERGVDVLIATPGRLWDIIQEDDELATQIRSLEFLVLDEADRMIEAGHFEELDNIIKMTLRPAQKDPNQDTVESDPHFAALAGEAGLSLTEVPPNEHLQTLVYSATLSKDLQKNLSRRSKGGNKKRKYQPATTLDDLLMRLDFRDPDPFIIDLSPEGGAVSTLQESKIECLMSEKDVFLYYFLLRYPGRSLVFVSSIDGIRRLVPLLEQLQIKVFPLHSQLQQKQRLKNLDRFKSSPNGVLVATDVAARGLDVPSVDHVIHYQIPRSADIYVHRNGRTARAQRQGFSLQLCGPEERKTARAVLQSLGRGDDAIPELSVDHDFLDKLKNRVTMARKIDNALHNVKKVNHERNWLKETAEAMELELDPDVFGNSDDEQSKKAGGKIHSAKVSAMKAELRAMIAQPLVARGISVKYLTSGSRSIVDDLVASHGHESMIGATVKGARLDVAKAKGKAKGKHAQATTS